MALKRYQERVVREFDFYFEALREAQTRGESFPSLAAWQATKKSGARPYLTGQTGDGQDLPWVALKVPTGGGKTLLATQILASAYRHWLRERSGAGLVVWVVPSDQIYRDTLRALRDPNHLIRASLESALSHRIEVWEKETIARLTPAQLGEGLNILLVKLQGSNRRDKESLKFFRDCGGHITRHFPTEDDEVGHAQWLAQTPNLDFWEVLGQSPQIKTSLANLVRLQRPLVIIDEGQKAASALARETIRGFNPACVIELSATPPADAAVLSLVSGQELLDEEMIKLPLNVSTETGGVWGHCLSKAFDRRAELELQARQHFAQTGILIRPMVLVQVERTGKDQRSAKHIHALDAFDYLTQNLGVPAAAVKIKSSERDDIEGIDLMAPDCPVEWIITKQALQEGWDCPFAYVLVSLGNSQSVTAMTQLAGRVLRQPYQSKTGFEALNESYVYCLHSSPAEIVRGIRATLASEGYEGDRVSVIDTQSEAKRPLARIAPMRPRFATEYGEPECGRVMLPRFILQLESGHSERYDYYAHSLPLVNWRAFDLSEIGSWDLRGDIARAREIFHRIHLHEEALEPLDVRALEREGLEEDERALAWLVANLGFDWVSAKRLRPLVAEVHATLLQTHGATLRNRLSLVRFALVERLQGWIEAQCNAQTEAQFEKWLYDEGRFQFRPEPVSLNAIIPEVIPCAVGGATRRDGSGFRKSLHQEIAPVGNQLEMDFAEELEESADVHWWYRNPVSAEGFWIQGPRRNRIYPDYIARRSPRLGLVPSVFFLESKGGHLGGNADTAYKKKVAEYFSFLGAQPATWQETTWLDAPVMDGAQLGKHRFLFEVIEAESPTWRDELRQTLEKPEI